MDTEEDKKKWMQQVGVFVTVPFVLSVPPVLGWFIGQWLDDHLGTAPFLMYSLIILGFVAGCREFYRLIKRFGNGT